jgi:aromatic ring-opening dioxygenase catalytic subunit (LigB family)
MNIPGNSRKAQIVYFSHGGGPLPILGDPGHIAMVAFLKALPARLRRPKAVLVISAHWEEERATLIGAERPPMLYDYYGFPKEAYEISYPAPGSPDLARRIVEVLGASGTPAAIDPKRGFDHGLFIPMKLMYPEAEVPCLQLSLLSSLDPKAHFELGEALSPLAEQDILIMGSGFSFHNMQAFDWGGAKARDRGNDEFQDWLIDVCAGKRAKKDRKDALISWEKAPSARYCHPREEHLLPLHVCAGIAGDEPAELVFDDYILGKRAVGFLWP